MPEFIKNEVKVRALSNEEAFPWVMTLTIIGLVIALLNIGWSVVHSIRIRRFNAFNISLMFATLVWFSRMILFLLLSSNWFASTPSISKSTAVEAYIFTLNSVCRVLNLVAMAIYLLLIQVRFRLVNRFLNNTDVLQLCMILLTSILSVAVLASYLWLPFTQSAINEVGMKQLTFLISMSLTTAWDIYFIVVDFLIGIALLLRCYLTSKTLKKINVSSEDSKEELKLLFSISKVAFMWLFFSFAWIVTLIVSCYEWYQDPFSERNLTWIISALGLIFNSLQVLFY